MATDIDDRKEARRMPQHEQRRRDRGRNRPRGEDESEGRPHLITDDDFHEVEARAEELHKKLSTGGPLGRFIDDARLLGEMARDMSARRYRDVPWWTLAAIGGTLLYLVNPFDIVPDMLPVLGYLDDATVAAVCLLMIEQQLHIYRDWRDGQGSQGHGRERGREGRDRGREGLGSGHQGPVVDGL